MQNLKILNSREIRQIHDLLQEQFGFEKQLDYAFLMNNKNKIYVINREFSQIDAKKLRINSVGLYFGELHNNELRLSIEGTQLIGPHSKKNILELDEVSARDWLKGFDIKTDIAQRQFFLLKYKNDFLGCGKVVENKILNFVPKNRRLKASD